METENQGALAFLKLFDPSRKKKCSVHSVNLGYAFWLGGSVLRVLVNELTILDESDVPENRARLDFNRWCQRLENPCVLKYLPTHRILSTTVSICFG